MKGMENTNQNSRIKSENIISAKQIQLRIHQVENTVIIFQYVFP